jgi:hypothetical protein
MGVVHYFFRGLNFVGLPYHLVDSRVLRNKRLQTPSGPEGSSGSNPLCVPQGSLAINKLFIEYKLIEDKL